MKEVEFRKARAEEIETVLLLLKEATLWLRTKGIDYWQDWIWPPAHFVEWIREGFEKNEFHMVEKDGNVIGCFRLQWQDKLFWGEQEDNAGYIHSFTISRGLAGQGIGKSVLGLIEFHCKQNGKIFLRLDCGAGIDGLRNYYEQYGFKQAGEVTVMGEQLILYEKLIT
jgi:N-acetylglutamate synthase-like GNAT family acetyltransferase